MNVSLLNERKTSASQKTNASIKKKKSRDRTDPEAQGKLPEIESPKSIQLIVP